MKSIDLLPLGSGAIAGNPFAIDRLKLASDLGFEGVTLNSMQAVGDRNFVGKIKWCATTNPPLPKIFKNIEMLNNGDF